MPRKCERAREHVGFSPEWGNEFAKYATNLHKAQKWRVDPMLDLEDLLQDAFLIFTKIKVTYPRVIEPRHFMALYKRALINSLHDKAAYKQRRGNICVHLGIDAADLGIGRIGETSNAGYLA